LHCSPLQAKVVFSFYFHCAVVTSNYCLQLVTWADYSSAKRDGTLQTLLQPLQQTGGASQAGALKRPIEAVANSGVSALTGQAVPAGQAPPAKKKLKSMVPSCRMM